MPLITALVPATRRAMAISQELIDAYIASLMEGTIARKGAIRVRFADQETEFESVQDAIDGLNRLQQQAAGSRTRYAAFSKGIR